MKYLNTNFTTNGSNKMKIKEQQKIKMGIGKIISKNKIKLVRGYSYISAFAIPFLVARELDGLLPGIGWEVLFILSIIGVWTIGHIDFKTLWKNELEYTLTKNPEWTRTTSELIKSIIKENAKLQKTVSSKKA